MEKTEKIYIHLIKKEFELMKKKILSFALCLVLLFSAVSSVPFEKGFLALAASSTTSVTTLRALYESIPQKSQWSRIYIDNDALDTLETAYDLAKRTLDNSDSDSATIELAESFLDSALKSVSYHTLDINIDKRSLTANVGESVELSASLEPENAADKVTWSSGNPSVASVSQSGAVDVKKYSSTPVTITATSNGHTSICTITVKNPIGGVEVSKSSEIIYSGKSFSLSYSVYGADRDAAITEKIDSVTWSSLFPAVASVTQDGVVTALKEGSTTVTVTVKSGENEYKSSCSVTVGKLIPVTGFEPQTVSDGGTLTSVIGKDEEIKVKVLPSTASIKELKWESSNTAVASVSSNGIVDSSASATVKSLSVGKAVITYTSTDGSNVSGSFTIEVKPKISALSVSPEKIVLSAGTKGEKISTTVTPKDAGNQVIFWSSSNTSICDVSTLGVLNPKKNGTCTITAKTTDGSNISKEVYVRVADLAISVSLQPTTLNINVGQTSSLSATVTTSSDIYKDDVAWSSGDSKIATVDQNGVVKGVYPGKTTIKALALDGSGKSSVCTVNVSAAVTGVELPSSAVVGVNKTYKLGATVLPSYANNKAVSWKSSNTNIVDVASDGTLTGKSVGVATVTCTTIDGGFTASCSVQVVDPVTGVSVNPKTRSVEAGSTFRIVETVSPSTATIKSVTWSSSDEKVATVNSLGVVTAVAGGKCVITCKTDNGGFTASCEVTVTQGVSGITLEPKTVSIYKTQTAQLTATVLPATATNKTVNWSTDNSKIAVVSSSGVVTGVANGSAIITATTADGGFKAQCTVVVGNKVDVKGITLSESEIVLGKNETFTLDATISPSNASNKTVLWTSSATNVAKVSSSGTVTGVGNGSAVITATTADGGYTAKCKVEVSQGVSGVTLNKVTAKIAVSQALPLVATVQPTDASNKAVKWESSNPKVATVNSAGVVTGVSAGNATITVTTVDGSKTAYCSVTVYTPVTDIKINSKKVTVAKGGKTVVTATVLPENADDREYTWSSKDESIATISASGQITGKKIGDTVIIATSHEGSKKAYCIVEVVQIATGVSLDFSSVTLDAGKTKTLTATVKPTNASDKTLKWTSSDTKVATVNSKGVVTAVSAGSAVITATTTDSSNLSATCKINVTQKITKITFSKKTFDAKAGEKTKLTYTLSPSNVTDKTLYWSSADKNIATVSSKGVVTGVSAGKVKITARTSDGKVKASCTVNVIMPVKSVKMSKSSMTLGIGKSATLSAVVSPKTATNKEVTWKSSDYDVADVSSTGKVTAKKIGSAVITATTKDGSFTCTCRVNVVRSVKGISLDITKKTIEPNESFTLNYTLKPKNPTNAGVKWSTGNSKVATVSKKGVVKAVGKGTTTITVTTDDGGFTASCTVNVVKKVTGVSLNRNAMTLVFGKTATLTATVKPKSASDKTVFWRSSDTKVATVDQKGVVTAKGPGSAVITATTKDGSFKAKCTVTVVVKAQSLTLKSTACTVKSGSSVKLGYTVSPSNTTDKSLTWKTSNKKIATVNKNGVVTGVAGGTARITAETENGITATCTVTVIQTPSSVRLSQSEVSLKKGKTVTLTATVLPKNANDRTVKWSSSNTKVATVDKNGVVKALSAGTAVITAKTNEGGKSAKCTVTVIQRVSSVKLSSSSLSVKVGQTATLKATVKPTNATNKAVSWSSSNTAVAKVNKNGVVTGVAGGSAVITVKTADGSKTDKCTVTVTVPVSGITMAEKTIEIADGTKKTLSFTVLPSDAGNKKVTWQSNATDIVSVDSNGVITANATGKAVVTAKTVDGGFTASAEITVYKGVRVIALSDNSLSMDIGKTATLTAVPTPSDAKYKTVTWSSSDSSVASVSAAGVVTANKGGKVTITASCENERVKNTCTVTVIQPVTAIAFKSSSVEVYKGKTKTLEAVVSPSNATNKTVVWSSSNAAVATVNSLGVLTAVSKGSTEITARTQDGSFTAKCTVKVIVAGEKINLSTQKAFLAVGESIKVSGEVVPSDAEYTELSWTSSKPAVATVDGNGNIKAVSAGKAEVTVKNKDNTATAKVAVEVIVPASDVTVNGTKSTAWVGESFTLKTQFTPSNVTYTTALFSSSNTKVATVDKNGVVSPLAPGECVITIASQCGRVSKTFKLTVKQKVTAIKLSKATLALEAGETATVTATVLPENATNKAVTWESTNTAVASVDQSGVVKAVAKGTTTISVKSSDGVSAKCTVTVSKHAESVTFEKTAYTVENGKTLTLKATVLPTDTSFSVLSYSSSDKSVATVNSSGVVTAKGVGTTTISAKTQDGVTGICRVTVKQSPSKLSISSTAKTLAEGATLSLSVTFEPKTTTEKGLTWTSSNTSVATVDKNGVVTAVSKGEATITAKSTANSKLSVSCVVTVTRKVTGVDIKEESVSLVVDSRATKLTVNVLPAGATNQKVTWKSSDTSVATVDQNGNVTAKSKGTAVISVTTADGAYKDTCKVTVK